MKLLKIIYQNTIKECFLKIKFVLFRIIWRKRNLKNFTKVMNFFPIEDVKVGDYSYGELNIIKFNRKSKLKIGCYCSIGQNVSFVLDADHLLDSISTYPFKALLLNTEKYEASSKGDIIIDDDVWIGYGATIMSGVHIGQGAVVAAGSLVTKNIPPYAIVGGIPARIIKYRFNLNIINEMVKIDYSKLNKAIIESHLEELYQELNDIKQLEWLPKKRGL